MHFSEDTLGLDLPKEEPLPVHSPLPLLEDVTDRLPEAQRSLPVDFKCASGHMVMALYDVEKGFVDLEGALCPVCIGSVTAAGDVIAVLNQRRLAALVLKRVTAGGDAGEGKESTNGQNGHSDVHPPEAG